MGDSESPITSPGSRGVLRWSLTTWIAITSSVSYAQSPEPSPESSTLEAPRRSAQMQTTEDETDEEETEVAPQGQVSGRIKNLDEKPGLVRQSGRLLLYPLRGAWWLVTSPLRGLVWTFDRYALGSRFRDLFFNEDGTIGLYPVLLAETGFGLNGGGRFVWRNIGDTGAALQLRAGAGGQFRQRYSATFTTGQLGDVLSLEALGEYQQFPKSRFFGFGNRDEVSVAAAQNRGLPISPDAASVSTRYRHDTTRATLRARLDLGEYAYVRPSVTYRTREFENEVDVRGDAALFDVYDIQQLTGYVDGLSNIYTELELGWDTRETPKPYHSDAAPSRGVKAVGFVGYQGGYDDDPSDHVRWGIDVQHYINLFFGDRTLVLRGYIEGVTGELDTVPFLDLPAMGGPVFLRGYARDRFRDRHIAFGTIEYEYPVIPFVRAYAFVDAGVPFRRFEDFDDEIENLRVGFGGGFQFQTLSSFIARLVIGSSIDGGVTVQFALNSVFDVRSRQESP
ncbi:MAG: hypothetical protein AAF735_01115 [Myxococcota bacterium]